LTPTEGTVPWGPFCRCYCPEKLEEIVSDIKTRVEQVLEEIKPVLQADGGDIELVEVTDDNVVRVRLQGACKGCPGAQMTLSMAVEGRLKEVIPEIDHVESAE